MRKLGQDPYILYAVQILPGKKHECKIRAVQIRFKRDLTVVTPLRDFVGEFFEETKVGITAVVTVTACLGADTKMVSGVPRQGGARHGRKQHDANRAAGAGRSLCSSTV